MEENEYAVSIDDVLWVAANNREEAFENARHEFIEHLQTAQHVEAQIVDEKV